MTPFPPPLPQAPPGLPAPPVQKTLDRLFLTLFLRGRSSRGLKGQRLSTSVGQKLAFVLAMYLLLGLVSLMFIHQPVFALSVYLHAMTFSFLGLYLASSVGEVLFVKEEADILLHRPIHPQTLLWAKIRVLLQVSFWLSASFNLVGFFVGTASPDGGWRFLPAHVLSVTMETLFCAGSVVMCYQLCLRWFGRERLDGLITTAQVVVAVASVAGGQLLPQIALRVNKVAAIDQYSWWIGLLPPAWFAGFDDAIGGAMTSRSWLLASIATAATIAVLWIAFSKLARNFEAGMQLLSESVSTTRRGQTRRRWSAKLIGVLPLPWWRRDPVARASFVLTAAYLLRDRDVKLRVYPSIAPILVMPLILLARNHDSAGVDTDGFMAAFAGCYVSIVPAMTLNLLQHSQQWQASDVFRAAPMAGPASLCHGARRAVICIVAVPMMCAIAAVTWAVGRDASQLLLLLPGVVTMPIFAVMASRGGRAVPLSRPTEESKGASRGATLIGIMMASFAVAGLAAVSWHEHIFHWFMLAEVLLSFALYAILRMSFGGQSWASLE